MKIIIFLLFVMTTNSFSFFLEPKKGDNIKEITFFNLQVENLKNKELLVQVREINNLVNSKIEYLSDLENYTKEDYLATANETINKLKGDCDDYVILKMKMLDYLNIKHTVLFCQIKGVWHVKLVVLNEAGEKKYVLDSANKNLRIYSLKEGNIFYGGEKFKKIAIL